MASRQDPNKKMMVEFLGQMEDVENAEDDNNSNTIMASYYYGQLQDVEEDVMMRPRLENMNSEGGDDDDWYEKYGTRNMRMELRKARLL